jgi:uncharacterized phage-associated protein
MSYDSRAIANHFLRLAKEDGSNLSNMKLQKLIYYAHGHWLGEHNEPLLSEVIQAWQWGPVVQSVYDEFKRFGNRPITTRAADWDGNVYRLPRDVVGEAARSYIKRVYDAYKGYTAAQLSDQTHQTGTPWAKVVSEYGGKVPMFKEIPQGEIAQFFKNRPLGQVPVN